MPERESIANSILENLARLAEAEVERKNALDAKLVADLEAATKFEEERQTLLGLHAETAEVIRSDISS